MKYKKDIVDDAFLCKLLSDESRLSILAYLLKHKEGVYVYQVEKALEGLSQSAVSHQLSFLLREDIVETEREGQYIRYSLSTSAVSLKLKKILKALGRS